MTCEEVDDSAPGYALDILDASRRSSVAAHLLRCGRCREVVYRTQAAADRLLDVGSGGYAPPEPLWPHPSQSEPLLPDDDLPEDWFSDSEPRAVRPGRRRLRAAVTLAVVMVLVVGTTLGPELDQSGRPATHPDVAVALDNGSQAVGSIRVFSGQPPILEVEVRGLSETGNVRCELFESSGQVVDLGQFRLLRGGASWAASEPKSLTHPTDVLLLDDSGRVLASASLS